MRQAWDTARVRARARAGACATTFARPWARGAHATWYRAGSSPSIRRDRLARGGTWGRTRKCVVPTRPPGDMQGERGGGSWVGHGGHARARRGGEWVMGDCWWEGGEERGDRGVGGEGREGRRGVTGECGGRGEEGGDGEMWGGA